VTVEVSNLKRTFARGAHSVPVLDNLSFTVAAGEFLAILGPSGCGKSTLLRILAGLDFQDAGVVNRGALGKEEVGFVFQEAHLLPWRTLRQNVALPLELIGIAGGEREQRVSELLDMVGLADAGDRYPNELSGGMQMRGSLARALSTRPRLLLLDEPFAALDEITRLRLDSLLYDIWRERRFTAVFVTHSLREAAFLCERTLVLSRRPARIIKDERVPFEARNPELRASAPFNQYVEALYQTLVAAEGA
jgi:NitT/TauT family transport system ATP-binding protein